jgi:hypothetical protein
MKNHLRFYKPVQNKISMTAFSAIGIQSALSMIIFSLLAVFYLVPHFRKLKLKQAIVPLLWINTFRYLPLILCAPGQVSASIPESVSTVIAYGDLISGLLALAAVLFITFNISGAMIITWLFLIVGTLDSINGVYTAMSAEAYQFPLGFSWMVVTFFVPLIFVSEALIIQQLITNKNR